MMVEIQETKGLGIHCGGRACAVLAIVLAGLTLVTSLAYTLVTRIYIHGYYSSAHIAGIITFISVFVLTHHLMRVRLLLGCGSQFFIIIQCLMNLWLLLCCLTISVSYTILAVWSSPNDLDFISTAAWGWVGVAFMGYLTSLSFVAIRGDWYSSYDLATTRTSFVYHAAGDLPLKDLSYLQTPNSSKASLVSELKKPPVDCTKCCRGFLHVLYAAIYIIFHLIFAVVVFLSAYHPCGVLYDWANDRPSDHMYTVSVGGHRPVSLYLRCRGQGNDTIVYENGMGSVAMQQWHFLPRFLEDDFRVCVHDRRSHGWSQGFENDFLPTVREEEQDPRSSTEHFRALIKEAGISTPFYYAGHSYGGHHITTTAMLYPDLVKGLIYLDSSKFSNFPSLNNLEQGDIEYINHILELFANFFPLGLVRASLSCCVDAMDIIQTTMDIDNLPYDILHEVVTLFRSGNTFTGFLREYRHMNKAILEPYKIGTHYLNHYPEIYLRLLLEKSSQVDKPVLVIDAGDRNKDWFPKEYFPQYRDTNHVVMYNASHTSLVYSEQYGRNTSQYIRTFIQSLKVPI